MTDVLHSAAAVEPATEAGGTEAPVRRRGMLGLLAKGGIALVAGVAGVLATASPAEADCQHSPCCSLASCRICPNDCHYRCPSGYHAKMWTCASAGRLVWCGECTTSSSSCWNGSFYCSVWWFDEHCLR